MFANRSSDLMGISSFAHHSLLPALDALALHTQLHILCMHVQYE